MKPFKQAFDFLRAKSYQVLFYNDPNDHDYRSWTQQDFLKANEISLYTNRAIEKRAEKVSEVEFRLIDRKTQEIVEDSTLMAVLNRPNNHHTGKQFWALYQKYKDLIGAAYIYVEQGIPTFDKTGSNVKALHLLRPDLVRIVYQGGEIAAFEYSPPGGGVITYQPNEIIYSFNPDPRYPTRGVSLLQAGMLAIDTEHQLSRYHANVIRNGGNVGNVVKFKTPNLTKQQVTELKQQYDEQYAGARHGGKPMFLGGDADIIKLGMSPDELSYLESKRMILEDIVIMTGVPKALLGLPSGDTFANAQASIDVFLRETVKPLLTDLTTILDWRLIPDQYDLVFEDPTPKDQELQLKQTANGVTNYYMTPNEARDAHGLPPIEGGDELLVPVTVVPLSKALQQQEPPHPEDPNAPVLPNDPNADPNAKKRFKEHPLKDKSVREAYGKVMLKRLDRNELTVRTAIKDYFLDQRKRLLSKIDNTRSFRRKDLIDETFNVSAEIALAKGTLEPLIRSILKKAGQDTIDFTEGVRPFVLSSSIESWLERRARLFAGQITDTTFQTLKDAFQQSLDAGETRQQLVNRIRDVYEGYDDARAHTIAVTEVHAATQEGTFQGYKQVGLDTKIWVWAPGVKGGEREEHLAIDGQEVPINAPFSNGLMYPGDPAASPDDTINCNCSI